MIVIVFILIALVIFIYKIQNDVEGLEILVGSETTAEATDEIFKMNYQGALKTWNTVGCTNGTYKPIENSAGDGNKWKTNEEYKRLTNEEYKRLPGQKQREHLPWKEAVLKLKKKADEQDKEHNYYDWVGSDTELGIRDSIKRCYGDPGQYTFPKLGDRVKIKNVDKLQGVDKITYDYHTGIVTDSTASDSAPVAGDVVNDGIEVLWDTQGNENTNEKDKKRMKTKGMGVETDNDVIKMETGDYGWPNHKWDRHPDFKTDKKVNQNSWVGMNDMTDGKIDRKEVYKMKTCIKDSLCDNLNCGKIKTEILNRYPITYYCDLEANKKNDRNVKDGEGWRCLTNGAITQYYDENSMCLSHEKGTSYGRQFCLQTCGGNDSNCVPYDNVENISDRGECFVLLTDNEDGKGNRAYFKMKNKSHTNENWETNFKHFEGGKARYINLGGTNPYRRAELPDGTVIYPGVPTKTLGVKGIRLYIEPKSIVVTIELPKKKTLYLTDIVTKKGYNNGKNLRLPFKGIETVKKLSLGGGSTDKAHKIYKTHIRSGVIKFYIKMPNLFKPEVDYKMKSLVHFTNNCGIHDEDFDFPDSDQNYTKKHLVCRPFSKDANASFQFIHEGDGWSMLSPFKYKINWNGDMCWYAKNTIRCDTDISHKDIDGGNDDASNDIYIIQPLDSDAWRRKVNECLECDDWVNPGVCTLFNIGVNKYCANEKNYLIGGQMDCTRNNADTWERYIFSIA